MHFKAHYMITHFIYLCSIALCNTLYSHVLPMSVMDYVSGIFSTPMRLKYLCADTEYL